MTCEICNSRTYNKLENRCSLSVCPNCGHEHLNGIGLSGINSNNKEAWDKVLEEWHNNVYDETIKLGGS